MLFSTLPRWTGHSEHFNIGVAVATPIWARPRRGCWHDRRGHERGVSQATYKDWPAQQPLREMLSNLGVEVASGC